MTEGSTPNLLPKQILLAEDNPHDRFLLEECFLSAGIAVHMDWMSDGDQALARLLEPRSAPAAAYDLVILDANLPKRGAASILAAVREAGAAIPSPVVVLSSMVTPQRKAALLQLGARQVMSKPLDLGDYDRLALSLNDIMRQGV